MEHVALDHIALSVADIDGTRDFYARAFGFVTELEFEVPAHPIRGTVLLHPSGARLELFEHAGSRPGIQGVKPIPAMATRGYGHFAFRTPDIDLQFAAAVEAGGTVVTEPTPTFRPGVRSGYVSDPEGNLVELIERL